MLEQIQYDGQCTVDNLRAAMWVLDGCGAFMNTAAVIDYNGIPVLLYNCSINEKKNVADQIHRPEDAGGLRGFLEGLFEPFLFEQEDGFNSTIKVNKTGNHGVPSFSVSMCLYLKPGLQAELEEILGNYQDVSKEIHDRFYGLD